MKQRLVIEFLSKDALLEYVDQWNRLRDPDWEPKLAAYKVDALDNIRADKTTFILRKEGSRPDAWKA